MPPGMRGSLRSRNAAFPARSSATSPGTAGTCPAGHCQSCTPSRTTKQGPYDGSIRPLPRSARTGPMGCIRDRGTPPRYGAGVGGEGLLGLPRAARPLQRAGRGSSETALQRRDVTLQEKDYAAGPFRPLAETELGRQLWRFLNEDSVVIRLGTATELGKPAVAGIEGALRCRFREKVVGRDRIKQMVGHMVRQVLEGKGYCLEKQNAIINSALFSKGTRYSRPEWRRLHVFRKTGDKRELCFAGTRRPCRPLRRAAGGDLQDRFCPRCAEKSSTDWTSGRSAWKWMKTAMRFAGRGRRFPQGLREPSGSGVARQCSPDR